MSNVSSSAFEGDLDKLISYLDEAPIRLAVFGEFSAGKTTVLNALIGEEILSVAVEPTTAVPTRVRYGREFNIFIDRISGGQLALFEDDPPFWTRFVGRKDTLSTLQKQQGTIRDFLRTWTKEGERAEEVERVVIELPLDWLKSGLELVDTPGVNNEFARHQGFTEQEAGDADIAVLLMDARQGGGKRTEFEFMNEVQGQVGRSVVAPNKMDLVPADEREEFLDYIRETALPNHWNGAVTPPTVGISALAALHPDEHEEPGLVSAFEDLRGRLERMAEEERGKLLLARKGNPEKELFGQAKELEGKELYGRAHRVYFDLLDILQAAGLDPTPAEEGVARCEKHLSDQVDALDNLNERYNEAMALAEEDPERALERLEAIRDEKEDLRLEDGDIHASLDDLESRIERRDEARGEIRVKRQLVKKHRRDDNWSRAAEVASKCLQWIDKAELSEDDEAELRRWVKKQTDDRDEWRNRRRRKVEMALNEADERPEEALAQLQEVHEEGKLPEKSNVNLSEQISSLKERIRRRDEAQQQIQELQESVESHRKNERWIKAGEEAEKIRPLIETAELSEKTARSLRESIRTQIQSRDEQAEERWKRVKSKADACVEKKQYQNAAEYLDDLKMVAPYTPYEDETAKFAKEIVGKAELEMEYRKAVSAALEEAKMLRRDRVDLEEGKAVESAIRAIEKPYRALYGVPDLPTRQPLKDDALLLTIDQKLGLARHLRTLAERSPKHSAVEDLADELRERQREIRTLSLDDRDGLDLVEEHPDHPEAEAALDELLNERLPFWTLPSQIRRTQAAAEKYQDLLPEDKVEERMEELEERSRHFQWHERDSPIAVLLSLIGLFFGSVLIFSGVIVTGLIVCLFFTFVATMIQYIGSKSPKKDNLQEQDSVRRDRSHQSLEGDEGTKRKLDGGRPAGMWQCPSCGNEKHKGAGYTGVMCQRCRSQMRFARAEN